MYTLVYRVAWHPSYDAASIVWVARGGGEGGGALLAIAHQRTGAAAADLTSDGRACQTVLATS
jgi:hypothetical protein